MVAGILIALITGLVLLLYLVSNKQKQKSMKQLSYQLSRIGSEYNLSFASQEVLKDYVFGLDAMKRKILFIHRLQNGVYHDEVIVLDEIKTCTVKKVYGSIERGTLKNKKLDQHLIKIVLHFEFNNNKEAVELCFYDDRQNSVYQISEMEQKARHWQAILSKLITNAKSVA
jgi:hypothetical protein